MSDQGDVVVGLKKEVVSSPAEKTAMPQIAGKTVEEKRDSTDEGAEEEEEEEEEVRSSAHLELSTLPWPGDKDTKLLSDQNDDVSVSEERDTGISRGSQDLSEEGDERAKAKWRESMPEGERWRDDEIQVQSKDKGDGSLADDEEEEEEEEEEEDKKWISEKQSMGFIPHVEIVRPNSNDPPEESRYFREDEAQIEQMEPDSAPQFYEWEMHDDKYYLGEDFCREKLWLILATLAGGILFPFLVWGGYVLLPFDSPEMRSAPLRVMYTLRCSFFAIIPILLGVLVQGVARLSFGATKPLYQSNLVHKEVMVHWHYVNESLSLFLFYFLLLTVMATYISQDLLKLVPLLTIVFVFGRLIYWLCLALDSPARGLGFGLSFFPTLVMLGANLYYVCSSVGEEAVFDVAPPTTVAPPRMRWWF